MRIRCRRPRDRIQSILVVGALLALAAGGLAAPPVARADPAPLPTPLGRVSDFANVIDPHTEAKLTARLTEIQQKTGAEIAVVTVASTAPDDVFDYAMRLAESWKPGAREQDNGVVFLTAVADRKMHILTGYGLEGALPDGLVGEMRDRDILPRFRTGDYAGGIDAGVERLANAIAREYGVQLTGAPDSRQPQRRPRSRTDGIPILLILLVFFVILPNLRLVGRGRRRGRWMGPMWGTGFGGGGFGGRGGGFGGFGGGGFGGGGAGGSW